MKNPRKRSFPGINRIDFSAWRTEVRDERPSDRTAESHKAQTLVPQGFAGLGGRINLKFNRKKWGFCKDGGYKIHTQV